MNTGITVTGYIIPEKIDTKVLIIKFIGFDCLKYKMKDSDGNDNAKNGIIIIKTNKREIIIEENIKVWLPKNCIRNI